MKKCRLVVTAIWATAVVSCVEATDPEPADPPTGRFDEDEANLDEALQPDPLLGPDFYWQEAARLERLDGIKRAVVSTAAGILIMPYHVRDGMVIVDGDLVLGPEARMGRARERGFALTEVWHPDGNISWNTLGLSSAQGTKIENVMNAFEERTPLNMTRHADSASADVTYTMAVGSNVGGSGAITYGYWNPGQDPKQIAYYSTGSTNVLTTAHEFGHVLGFPHEHQRPDSPMVVCASDPWNNGAIGFGVWAAATFEYLSPFDISSRMLYRNSCVTDSSGVQAPQPTFEGNTAFLSRHDINSIYRVYATPLGDNDDAERFGHAIAVADFDGDGFEDIVAGANEATNYGVRELRLYVYRGVQTHESEDDAGRKYMPWFTTTVHNSIPETPAGRAVEMSLAPGDFDGDGRVELAVGLVGADGYGQVHIYRQRQRTGNASEPEDFLFDAPWGIKGFERLQLIAPFHVGLKAGRAHRFGSSVKAARLSDPNRDDLLIGAPAAQSAEQVFVEGPYGWYTAFREGGAVVHIAGTTGSSATPLAVGTHAVTWNPTGHVNAEFGAALTVRSAICDGLDTMIVGAPGQDNDAGAFHVFDCAHDSASFVAARTVRSSRYGSGAGGRFGQALDSFRATYNAGSGDVRHNFVVVGAPQYRYRGRRSGVAYVYRLDWGIPSYLTFVRDQYNLQGNQFGYSLAVVQTGRRAEDVRVAVGAPGARQSSQNGGRVYVWRPVLADGTGTTAGVKLHPYSSDRIDGTRYGHSLATIKLSDNIGGFAIGAPGGQRGGVASGFVQARINRRSIADTRWSSASQYLDQAIGGDRRPR